MPPWSCPRCDYDLRATVPPGRCPECGYTFTEDELRALASDPSLRLRRKRGAIVAKGVGWVVLAMIAGVGGVVLFALLWYLVISRLAA